MKSEQIKKLVSEVIKEVLEEDVRNLEYLHSGISHSTHVGKSWYVMVSALQKVYDDIEDFESQFLTSGVKIETEQAEQKLHSVFKLLEEIKTTIQQIDKVERNDLKR